MGDVYYEDKSKITSALFDLVSITRAGNDISGMRYSMAPEETVTIFYKGGGKRVINVACDSGIALIRDVVRRIK